MQFAKAIQDKTGKGYVSASSLKYAITGSKDFDMMAWELNMKGELKKTSKAFTFGGFYDSLLLTPDETWERYVVLQDDEICAEIGGKNPRATKRYKEWKEAQMGNKELITAVEHNVAKVMVNRLKSSEVVDYETGEVTNLAQFIAGTPQQEFNTWIGDVPVRGFLDVLGDGFITDVKTSSRSLSQFKWDVRDYNYDLQAWIYCEVYGIQDFYWLVQTKDKPYTCGLFKASAETLESGRSKFYDAVGNISEWLIESPKDTNTFAVQGTI